MDRCSVSPGIAVRLRRYPFFHQSPPPQPNPNLRGDLNHPSISRQAHTRLTQSGGVDAFHWIRIFRPLGIQNRWRTPPAAWHGVQSVRRMPAWLPSVGGWEFRRGVSSALYSPAAANAQRDIYHAAWPVRPQLTTVAQAVSSVAVECCGTDLTGVAIV